MTAVVLAGCTTSSTSSARLTAPARHHPKASSTTTSTTQPPVTPIVWTSCLDDLECGTLVVPLNYADPKGPTIPIAIARHPAEDPADRIGSLVIDPGGPGVSGIDDMANELSVLTPPILDDFDVVMFDPRGVGRSDPVECNQSSQQPAVTSDPVPDTPNEITMTIAALRQFAGDCEETVPTLLPYVGTVDTARDIDRLRQALGDAGLTYMGQSYGTLLGLTYARLFPTHVRAMVLDGVIDPALSFTEMTQQQATGFESVLTQFFAWCAAASPSPSSCAWRPSGDPTNALLAMLGATPGSSPAQTSGAGTLYDALLDGLYSRNTWPQLGATLAADAAGNTAPAASMSQHYNTSGSTNADDAVTAIDCLDHPTSRDLKAYAYLADALRAMAPVFGPLLAWGQAQCAVWPAKPTRPVGPVAATGAPPVLVIGTTGDPATPYQWAVNVSHELTRADLLTVEGIDHVAYFYSACVRDDVQTYLLSGATPPVGATCSS